MGGHSCYCAICGGPFGDISFSPPHPGPDAHPDALAGSSDDESGAEEEIDAITHDDVAWSGPEDDNDDEDDDSQSEDTDSDDTNNSQISEHDAIELSDDESEENETVDSTAQPDIDLSESEESEEDFNIGLDDMAPSEGLLESADEQMLEGNHLDFDDNQWDEEPGAAYDRRVLKPRHAHWIKTVYVIGCNQQAPGPSKCYLSGRGVADFYTGTVTFTPGPIRLRDPNYPRINGRRRPMQQTPTFTDWSYEAPWRWVYPVHMPCLKVLCQTLTGRPDPYGNSTLNKDALFFAFNALSDQLGGALNITYFPDRHQIPQYWECLPGDEYILANPLFKETPYPKQVLDLVSNAIKTSQDRQKSHMTGLAHKVVSDLFSRLPYDLVYEITRLLPDKDLFSLCSASYAVHVLLDINSEEFWPNRLTKVSMPWFEEALDILNQMRPPPTDWKSVMYNLQELLCNSGKQGVLMGVCNRKRIWKCCQTIGRSYFDKLKEIASQERGAQALVDRLEAYRAGERNGQGGTYHEEEVEEF